MTNIVGGSCLCKQRGKKLSFLNNVKKRNFEKKWVQQQQLRNKWTKSKENTSIILTSTKCWSHVQLFLESLMLSDSNIWIWHYFKIFNHCYTFERCIHHSLLEFEIGISRAYRKRQPLSPTRVEKLWCEENYSLE